MPASPEPRILEIGAFPFIHHAYLNSTVFISTTSEQGPALNSQSLSFANIPRLWKLTHGSDFDLIVCHPPFFAPWDPRWLFRTVFHKRTLRGEIPLISSFASQLLRGRLTAPLVVIDHEDVPYIMQHNFHLLDSCRYYFKRELPIDHWRLFQRTGHRDVPTPRYRSSKRNLARIEKVRPISLGLRALLGTHYPNRPEPKKVDVFFSGLLAQSSTVRSRGIGELLALRSKSITVDIPEQRLPREEFYARMAQARLVWSPEGLGWDCFRHYEAAACFSVPVISRPTVYRHRPLIAGLHAFYYDVEPGGLTQTICAALTDHAHLEAMAISAQAHVLANHSHRSLASYVVETALGKTSAS